VELIVCSFALSCVFVLSKLGCFCPLASFCGVFVSCCVCVFRFVFFFQAEDGIRDVAVTGVQTCALPILVWIFGRESFHVGASGINFGLLTFVFVIGALRWDKSAIALSCLVFFMYGSMIWGIFPTEPDVSFESHFFGAAIGVLCAICFRNVDPKPPEKHYDWEDETEELDNLIEGDKHTIQ